MSQTMMIPFGGQEIGQGFNSESRETVGTALSMEKVAEDPAADGQQTTTRFESVSTQESLLETLGVSVSVDARYGLFAGGAKVSFADSHAVNSTSSFVVGRCEVHNAIRHGHGPNLTEEAKQLLAAGRMEEFKLAFGDMFVRSLKTGGEFNVVARITSVSREHQTSLAASLRGEYNGLGASGSFKASLESASKETSGSTEVTVFMHQAGGVGEQAAFTGPDAASILARLKAFPGIVHEHPVCYEVELANYNTIPIPVPTREEQADRDLVFADCLAQKTNLLRTLADLDFMLGENASLFFDDLLPAEQLLALQGKYRVTLNALMAHAIGVSRGKLGLQMFVANPPPPPLVVKKKTFVAAEPIAMSILLAPITVDAVLLAGGWRSKPDLATMTADDRRNTLITELGPRIRTPDQFFLQRFNDDSLAAKGAMLLILAKSGIRTPEQLRMMSIDDQRNTLIVENAGRAKVTVPVQHGMTERELVQVALSWFQG